MQYSNYIITPSLSVALIIIEVVCNLLILLLLVVALARWRRVKMLGCLESLNSLSSLLLPFISSVSIILAALIPPGKTPLKINHYSPSHQIIKLVRDGFIF